MKSILIVFSLFLSLLFACSETKKTSEETNSKIDSTFEDSDLTDETGSDSLANVPNQPTQEELNIVLDKIIKTGYQSLNNDEKRILFNANPKDKNNH